MCSLKDLQTSLTNYDKERFRPSFEEIYLNLAFTIAKRSTCHRLQVGTVITTTDYRQVLAVGYNGNASGLKNACDRDEVGNCGCLHSEENAVINCNCSRSVEKIAFVTHHPCETCAKRLINLGNVQQIYYGKEYRSTKGREICEYLGISVNKLSTPFLFDSVL